MTKHISFDYLSHFRYIYHLLLIAKPKLFVVLPQKPSVPWLPLSSSSSFLWSSSLSFLQVLLNQLVWGKSDIYYVQYNFTVYGI